MTSLSFWYAFWHFVEPGILWRQIAPYSPMVILSAITLIFYCFKTREYTLADSLQFGSIVWTFSFLILRGITVISSGFASVLKEFIDFIPIHLFVIISIFLIRSPKDFNRFVWGVIFGGTFLVLYGIYAVNTGLRLSYGGLAGAYGNYENHNDYSFIILQSLPFLYIACIQKNNNFFKKILLLGLCAACVYGIFLSQSRGGMLALVLQSILIVLLTMNRKVKVVILPLILIVGFVAINIQYARRAATNGDHYTQAEAESSRFELWKAGINMFLDKPLLGVGSRRFYEYSKQYGQLSRDQFGKNSHNTYIEILSSTGLIGAFFFFMILLHIHKSLRLKLEDSDENPVDWIRLATLISFYTILFRAVLDAKDFDWSWYVFAIIAASCHAHRCRRHLKKPDTLIALNESSLYV